MGNVLKPDFIKKLEAVGFNIVKPVNVPGAPAKSEGFQETADVVVLLCDTANRAVNKQTFISIPFGEKLVNAAVGINKVPGEIIDLDETEANALYGIAIDNLEFDGEDEEDMESIERLAEKILLAALIIASAIAERIRFKQ